MKPEEVSNFIGVQIDPDRRRGRGAGINRTGRFEKKVKEIFDDGWQSVDDLPPFKTEVQTEKPKKIITHNNSPDISFDRSINPYRGCEHGCVYCFARPTHAYMGLSPGLDFETKLFAKPNAGELLEKELSAPNYEPRTIAIGTNTDPYQPIERNMQIMRDILEVLIRANHPVGIVTKSALVLRDLDLLTQLAEQNLVKVALSITTLDNKLHRAMEPRASAPQKRLDSIQKLNESKIPVTVMVAPIIPALNDSEIESILEKSRAAGASEAGFVMLRLPLELKEIFSDWLKRHYPDRHNHVISLMRSMRGGKDYDSEWGVRMRGSGPYAELIGNRFALAAKKFGFKKQRLKLDTSQFKSPKNFGNQLELL